MKFEAYVPKQFNEDHAAVLETALDIVQEYWEDGLKLTLRQLYYQFVARGLIENSQREYKRLGSIVNAGRLAGELPWDALEDRTRVPTVHPHWDSPADIVRAASNSFMVDFDEGQPAYVEVWVEKEALEGVIQQACHPLRVNYLACRGYPSSSMLWEAACRFRKRFEDAAFCRSEHVEVVVVHLGDHDPSGIDMTRDLEDRLNLFCENPPYLDDEDRYEFLPFNVEVRRIALNMGQIQKYSPPPNPAKLTDSRAAGYIQEFGYSSWELDALEPRVLRRLIEKEVSDLRDEEVTEGARKKEEEGRRELKEAAKNWDSLREFLHGR